ncbi:hypothetical protein ACQKGD_24855 [Peribacillus frigoritolerans]
MHFFVHLYLFKAERMKRNSLLKQFNNFRKKYWKWRSNNLE